MRVFFVFLIIKRKKIYLKFFTGNFETDNQINLNRINIDKGEFVNEGYTLIVLRHIKKELLKRKDFCKKSKVFDLNMVISIQIQFRVFGLN